MPTASLQPRETRSHGSAILFLWSGDVFFEDFHQMRYRRFWTGSFQVFCVSSSCTGHHTGNFKPSQRTLHIHHLALLPLHHQQSHRRQYSVTLLFNIHSNPLPNFKKSSILLCRPTAIRPSHSRVPLFININCRVTQTMLYHLGFPRISYILRTTLNLYSERTAAQCFL